MVLTNVLTAALKRINNTRKGSECQVLVRPCSRVMVRLLIVMTKHGYIGRFDIVDDHRLGKVAVSLTSWLNKREVISPRFDVHLEDLEEWQNNLLPAR